MEGGLEWVMQSDKAFQKELTSLAEGEVFGRNPEGLDMR